MSIDKPKIRFFERKIMDFYRKAGREHLPWRREGITAYEVWVSEIMLQQTQVSRVIDYYEKFLKRFPTVRDLAMATWEEFLPYYAGLGYYRRGRNMIKAAKKVVAEHGGEFPRDKKLLMKLPGVGDYTASAILSFAYGDDHLAWDTNLKRVVGRFFFGSKNVDLECHAELVSASQESGKRSRNKFGMTMPELSSGMATKNIFESSFRTSKKDLNAALMDFGSAVCTGRPKCNICPLQKQCRYFEEDGAQEKKQTADGGSKSAAKTDWKQAQVFLWLHENHRHYYSSRPDRFEIFVLPAAYNSREGIKEYFKKQHGLDLAVRPPHKKVYIEDHPTLFVNAQVLLGEPKFAVFPQEAAKEFLKDLMRKVGLH
jgi:A/G-specific adenine glycosylase